jgi:hypothetical protein
MINPYDSSDQGSGEFSEMQRVIGEMLFRVLPRVDLATRIGNAEGIGDAIRYGFIEPLREALDGIDDVTALAQRGYAADQARIGNAILTSTRLRARNCLARSTLDPLTVPHFRGSKTTMTPSKTMQERGLIERAKLYPWCSPGETRPAEDPPDFPSGPVRDLRFTVATNAVR